MLQQVRALNWQAKLKTNSSRKWRKIVLPLLAQAVIDVPSSTWFHTPLLSSITYQDLGWIDVGRGRLGSAQVF